MEVSTTLQSYGSRAQGWCFIMLGSISFLGFLSAAIVSRFLPVSENHIAIAITNDSIKKVAWQVVFGSLLMTSHVAAWVGKTTDCIVQLEMLINISIPDLFGVQDFCFQPCNIYYCFLVPLTLPIIVVAVYFHWLSMKFFKHA
ncbi:uncharacterized protein LOC114265342 isoform X2 [Camellia sinensis]|uniref:uncharacterized protein LOC114265342 isoform X2 n=1 Tax=Camellia sinensis TaxID=4442 RepID=UPI00103642ED|nr:uncharacterized protein LOC114265342 isoform X2 [Camellia sinensis]